MASLVAQASVSRSEYECPVASPYRLDLTVSALRRLSSNLVDVLTREGEYLRALGGLRRLVVARVTQPGPTTLAITLVGHENEHMRALDIVRRVLGVDRDLAYFDRAAAGIPWLKPLAEHMQGVRPPRYPTLWEACVNAMVSNRSASSPRRIKGIGPWTAAVILLRGLGRLDVFPMNDTSVRRNLALVSGSAAVDIESTLRALSPQQGMLYYHLLLARLEAQRDLGRPSTPARTGR